MMAGMRVAIVFVAIVGTSAVTPMTKVVTLLKNLQTKVEEQGQKEALQYEKYSCFCKNQAASKKADIDASTKEIERLDGIIANHDAIIGELGGDVSALDSDQRAATGDITLEEATRESQHEQNLKDSKEYQDAIDLVDSAIERMEASKGQLVKSDLYLTQLNSVVTNAKLGVQPKKDWLKAALALVKKSGKATTGVKKHIQAPHAHKYSGNSILAALQTVLKTLKEEKFAVDTREGTDRSDSETTVQALTNTVKFSNMDEAQKQTALEAETGKRALVDQQRALETARKNADQNFLNTLVAACQTKASDWDQRSQARADEMTAMAEAIAFLENGAVAKYKVNKKLVGLQYKTKLLSLMKVSAVPVSHHHHRHQKKLSFLQIGKGALSSQAEAGKRVLALLDSAASSLGSRSISALAFKVQLKIDHFEQVRALITDLVTKLGNDASSEADTKSMCDTQMGLAVADRDLAQSKIEEQNGIVAVQNAIIATKKTEITEHENTIASLNKEKLELNKMRATEKADNEAAVLEAQAGHDAVESALSTLRDFYGTLLQVKTQHQYTPPLADRNGRTVADAAPEAFSGDYEGAQAESKGVIGILEVISADFLRTVEAIGGTDEHEDGTEDEAVEAAEEQIENIDDEIGGENGAAANRDLAVTAMEDAEAEVVTAQSEANDRKALKASSKAQLEKLNSLCVEGEETYEERVAKREKEMAALRDAMKLLEELMA